MATHECTPRELRTDDIWFVDQEIGWAVNSNGQIVHTEDRRGVVVRAIARRRRLLPVRRIRFSHAWLGGHVDGFQALFQHAMAVRHWTAVANLPPGTPSANLWTVPWLSDQVVFASGTNFPNKPPAVIKTVDGGQTWTAIDMSLIC